MKHVKKQEEFIDINEMAKSYPVGSVIKISQENVGGKGLGRSTTGSSRDHRSKLSPKQAKGAEGGLFYMEIKMSGRAWLEGPILYTNCLLNDQSEIGYWAKASTAHAEPIGDEYRIFKKNEDKIKAVMKKSFFLDGSEKGIMSNDGKTATVNEAEYLATGLNFKLTDIYDEPVIFLIKKGSHYGVSGEGLSIKLSDIDALTKELGTEQKEVIASWFGQQLKCDMTVSGDRFYADNYIIQASDNSRGEYPQGFNAGPFMNREQAQEALDVIKKAKMSFFNPDKLDVIQTGRKDFNLETLIAYARTLGIKTTMKALLDLKKATIAAKKFGL